MKVLNLKSLPYAMATIAFAVMVSIIIIGLYSQLIVRPEKNLSLPSSINGEIPGAIFYSEKADWVVSEEIWLYHRGPRRLDPAITETLRRMDGITEVQEHDYIVMLRKSPNFGWKELFPKQPN